LHPFTGGREGNFRFSPSSDAEASLLDLLFVVERSRPPPSSEADTLLPPVPNEAVTPQGLGCRKGCACMRTAELPDLCRPRRPSAVRKREGQVVSELVVISV